MPFGYKAAKEWEDKESYEVVGRKTKAVGCWGVGGGEVQRRRSQGHREWVADGLCGAGWGGDLRRTGVVSRSFETDR